MKTNTKYLIGDALLFYVTAIVVIVSILSIDFIWDCGFMTFIADIVFCAVLIYACKIAIPESSYKTILGYNLWSNLLHGSNKTKEK